VSPTRGRTRGRSGPPCTSRRCGSDVDPPGHVGDGGDGGDGGHPGHDLSDVIGHGLARARVVAPAANAASTCGTQSPIRARTGRAIYSRTYSLGWSTPHAHPRSILLLLSLMSAISIGCLRAVGWRRTDGRTAGATGGQGLRGVRLSQRGGDADEVTVCGYAATGSGRPDSTLKHGSSSAGSSNVLGIRAGRSPRKPAACRRYTRTRVSESCS
jgi:hypothetical protein